MSQVVIQVAAGQRLLAELIDGEVDGVGWPSAQTHGGNAPVEPSRPIGLEDRFESGSDPHVLDGARPDCLHPGLQGVDGEHRHVFGAPGDGTGDHELPELQPIVLVGGRFRR